MKIWVTGATGSLGKELVKELKIAYPGTILFAPSSTELDLTDSEAVDEFVQLNKPTHVFHLAAKVFGIAGHKEQPTTSFITNTSIDYSLFSALLKFPPKWIYYASTVAAYGYPYKKLPLDEEDWLFGNPHESELGYALSKRYGLSYLTLLRQISETKFVYGLNTNFFGNADRCLDGRGHVFISLLEKAAKILPKNEPLTIWGDGTASRDFLSTKSASKIICELIDIHTGVLNIASGQEIQIAEVANQICKAFQLTQGIKHTGFNQGITRRVCSISKLENFSNWIQHVDSRTELSQEIEAYKNSVFIR